MQIWILIILLTFTLFVGCTKEYKGKNISRIEFKDIDYMGGYEEEIIYDFKNNLATKSYMIPDSCEPYIIDYSLDNSKYIETFNELNEIGFFKLKERYETSEVIMDGGARYIKIVYDDESYKETVMINSSTGIEVEYAIIFYKLVNEDLLGGAPYEYLNPPKIDIECSHIIGNGERWDNVDTKITNYTWNGKEVADISVVEGIKDVPATVLITDDLYKLVIITKQLPYKFKKLTINSYDLNGNDMKNIDNVKWFKQKEWELDGNRIYQIIAEYEYGTVEMVFYTVSS